MPPDPTNIPRPSRQRYPRIKGRATQDVEGLHDEIIILRSILRMVNSMIDDGHQLPELLRVLDSVGAAATRLATLLKTQRELENRQDLAEALNEALAEVLREMGAR